LAEELGERLARSGFQGRTLTLKLRYADFHLLTRRTTRPGLFHEAAEILETGRHLLLQVGLRGPVRLLGVGISQEVREGDPRQLALL
jgi:DNA polymerase-4